MERTAWKAQLIPGKKKEYIERHNKIWPEMTELLNAAGIHNYSIWCFGDELFGYYEAEEGVDFAGKMQRESPIVAKWNEYMKDIMYMMTDDANKRFVPEQVFMHK